MNGESAATTIGIARTHNRLTAIKSGRYRCCLAPKARPQGFRRGFRSQIVQNSAVLCGFRFTTQSGSRMIELTEELRNVLSVLV